MRCDCGSPLIRGIELRASALGPGRVYMGCEAALAAPWVPEDMRLPCGALNTRGRLVVACIDARNALDDARKCGRGEDAAAARCEAAMQAYINWAAGNSGPTHATGSRGAWRLSAAS